MDRRPFLRLALAAPGSEGRLRRCTSSAREVEWTQWGGPTRISRQTPAGCATMAAAGRVWCGRRAARATRRGRRKACCIRDMASPPGDRAAPRTRKRAPRWGTRDAHGVQERGRRRDGTAPTRRRCSSAIASSSPVSPAACSASTRRPGSCCGRNSSGASTTAPR